MNTKYLLQFSNRNKMAIFQNSCSSELISKLTILHECKNELNEISNDYKEIVESELFENEYYHNKADELNKLFFMKQFQFMQLYENLKLVFNYPLILN